MHKVGANIIKTSEGSWEGPVARVTSGIVKLQNIITKPMESSNFTLREWLANFALFRYMFISIITGITGISLTIPKIISLWKTPVIPLVFVAILL